MTTLSNARAPRAMAPELRPDTPLETALDLPLACGPGCALHAVIDTLPAMLWVGDASGARHWIGSAFASFTGVASGAHAHPGCEWLAALHPEDVERWRGIALACGASALPFSLDYRLRTRDGLYRWVMDIAAPQGGGDAGRYVGICVDIHERRELEDQLAERTRKLRTSE